MGRPKTVRPDLPKYVKARVRNGNTLYYYQRHGREIALGRDYSNAEERAAALMALPPVGAMVEDLSAEQIIAKAIPARRQPGVYFLIVGGAIAYVGQSIDVWARIVQHMKVRRFDSFSWFPCPVSELDSVEAACIERFKPWQNYGVKSNFSERVLKLPS